MSKLYDLFDAVIGKLNKAIKTEAQTLTDEEKAQARENIGAAEEGTGGVSSWNDITDKPFHAVGGDTLTWDGNTEGLPVVDMTAITGLIYYKISDAAPTIEDFANGCEYSVMVEGIENKVSVGVDEVMPFYDGVISCHAVVFFAISESAVGVDLDGVVFPEAGTYVTSIIDDAGSVYISSLTIPGYTGFAKEVINEDALPEALRFGDKEIVILKEQELAVADGMCSAAISAPLNAGDNIIVKFDGASYKCEVLEINGNIGFGNKSLLGLDDNTGEPFGGAYASGTVMLIPGDAEATSHRVKITLNSIVEIGNEYIGALGVFYYNSSQDYIYTDIACTNKATYADVSKALRHGPVAMYYAVNSILVQVACNVTLTLRGGIDGVYYWNATFSSVSLYTAEYTGE